MVPGRRAFCNQEMKDFGVATSGDTSALDLAGSDVHEASEKRAG